MKVILSILVLLSSILCQTMPTYDRSSWGTWIDSDKDGQNTRQEVLIRDNIASSESTTYVNGKIVKGMWIDIYSGDTIRGASLIDIDHFVPVSEANMSGGYLWDKNKKINFFNNISDTKHLHAVSIASNRSKGAKDPSKWMPKINKDSYIIDWVTVKYKWGLKMDKEEYDFIISYLNTKFQ